MGFSIKASALLANFVALLAVQNVHAMPAPADVSDVTPTLSGRAEGVVTPSPAQPGMVDNCDKFYLVPSGENCAVTAAKNGIHPDRLLEWNGSVGKCYGLWANYNACVHTVGYEPTTTLECSADGWAWGDNKSAVDAAIKDWCDGKDSTDGSYGFAGGQVKNGCFNTPIGSHTIKFQVTNYIGAGSSLAPATCEKMLSDLVNGCPRGGKGQYEFYLLEASVPQGRC